MNYHGDHSMRCSYSGQGVGPGSGLLISAPAIACGAPAGCAESSTARRGAARPAGRTPPAAGRAGPEVLGLLHGMPGSTGRDINGCGPGLHSTGATKVSPEPAMEGCC